MPSVVRRGSAVHVTRLQQCPAHVAAKPREHLAQARPAGKVQGGLGLLVHDVDIGAVLAEHLTDVAQRCEEEGCLPVPVGNVCVALGLQEQLAEGRLAIEGSCVQNADALGVTLVRVRSGLQEQLHKLGLACLDGAAQRCARALPSVRPHATAQRLRHQAKRLLALLWCAICQQQGLRQLVQVLGGGLPRERSALRRSADRAAPCAAWGWPVAAAWWGDLTRGRAATPLAGWTSTGSPRLDAARPATSPCGRPADRGR
mmetsp:Transcript_24344/g.75751  ORF Transcript_24344/g.75751 Transcript_24344/m.75751 type:complete len:258 (+) Transcript_24344:1430-2203(+)